jgi:hypothetical protein
MPVAGQTEQPAARQHQHQDDGDESGRLQEDEDALEEEWRP